VPAPSLPDLSPSQILRLSQAPGTDNKTARASLVDLFGKDLERLATRTCRRCCLPPQERSDVVSETYQLVLNPEITRFAPSRGKPVDYLDGLVKNAARKIMTQLGRRRKAQAPDREMALVAPPADAGVEGGKRYRTSAPPLSPADDAEVHDTVNFILEQASPRVREALQLCYWEGWSLQSIAAQLGVSRFVLAREIRAFYEKMHVQLGDA
jgi:RNA polymerase sigma factor (sigma-70 family)